MVVEVWVLKKATRKGLTLFLLGEQRLQCLHNAHCHFWEVLPPVLLVQKHVACAQLMDIWLLPALFLSQTVHVTIFNPLEEQPVHQTGGFTSLACHKSNIEAQFEMGVKSYFSRFCKATLITSYPRYHYISNRCVFMHASTKDTNTELQVASLGLSRSCAVCRSRLHNHFRTITLTAQNFEVCFHFSI